MLSGKVLEGIHDVLTLMDTKAFARFCTQAGWHRDDVHVLFQCVWVGSTVGLVRDARSTGQFSMNFNQRAG